MNDNRTPQRGMKERGQALVEYALILAFVVIALIAILAATGPAVGNVFSNVVFNLIGQNPVDVTPLNLVGGAAGDFWATVTWVANNPQGETPYPTPLDLPTGGAPTQFLTYTPSETLTPSNTASQTPSRTHTATPSDTPNPTDGPSPTPEDKEFLVPFADRADDVLDWRLDRSYVLNPGDWDVSYYNGSSCSGTAVTTTTPWINYNWGPGSPDPSINADGFTACWTQNFTLAQDTLLEFTAENLVGGTMVVTLDGTTTILNANSQGDANSVTISAGNHDIAVTYTHTSGNAFVNLLVQRPSQNPSDVLPAGVDGCPWATTNDNVLSGSPLNVFDDDPATNSWPAGQRCYLELRGWINSASAVNPRLSFWDVWDFAGAAGVEARLEIANYVETSPGVLDRSVWNSPLYSAPVRSAGTANYNWTRTEIDLSTISGLGSRWTFRFVLANTSGSAQTLRWYIDDIQVLSNPTPNRVFTVNNVWNLNSRSQMADFIFNADANYTLEQTAGAPPSNEWRWNIASDFARSGTAFVLKDMAPSAGGPGTERLYTLEFRYPIDLTNAPSPDFDGDTGQPILTFWQIPQFGAGAIARVQYNDATASGPWVDIPYSSPVPSGPYTTMFQSTVPLSTIPVQPFRLRFAVTIPQGVTIGAGDGWFIDDIEIERDLDSLYTSYPFTDSAENPTDAAQNWTTNGTWARTSQTGGVAGSGFNYSDSPGAGVNYLPDQGDPDANATVFEMRKMIDLRGDTAGAPSHAAAVKPTLSFWMHYALQGEFEVQIWTALDDWTTVWRMDNGTLRTNTAWERVEVDLSAWATNSNPGVDNEDDIKIRFRLDGAGSVGYDGVYLDLIDIRDFEADVHTLTAPGIEFLDQIDAYVSVPAPSPSKPVNVRWHLGGQWNIHPGQGYLGTLGLSDSPGTTAHDFDWRSIAEMRTIFDLSGSLAGNYTSLDFLIKNNINTLDNFHVEIAQEQVGDSGPQVYDDMLGWGPWTTVPMSIQVAPNYLNGRVDTLRLARVNLSSYLGRRIRIRFVLETVSGSGSSDGVTIDNVRVNAYAPTNTPLTGNAWTDPTRWTYEGTWGSTDQYFTPGTAASLGSGQWEGVFYDCETLYSVDCGLHPAYNEQWLPEHGNDDTAAMCPGSLPAGMYCAPATTELNLWVADGDKPDPALPDEFIDTYAARWVRDVTFAPNTTYTIYVVSDAAMRLRIDNTANISPNSTDIINVWYPHGNQLDVATIQTDGAFSGTRRLMVDYYDIDGAGVISVSITSNRFSFSDSPNTFSGGSNYTTVLAQRWGNSSLMYNRFLNTGGGATLSYSMMWDLVTQNTIFVEASTDGGFTWSVINTHPGALQRNLYPPHASWENFTASLPGGSAVTFRFRLDTTANADNPNRDGIWVADITVS